jgi:glycerophosphoryl diester phosphodiesterase
MGIQERVCIQSFDPRALREVKKRAPEMTLALLVENTRGIDANVKELGFIPDIYSPYYKMVTANVVQKAHGLHMRIIPWTVNDRDTMVFLKGIGVDGIITDYPNRALANLSTEE